MSHFQYEPWQEHRWHSFERSSRLPFGYFDARMRWPLLIAAALAVVLLIACAAL